MQHDMNVGDAGGGSVREDFNVALQALATVSSGATAPTTTYPYQFWADVGEGVLRQRTADNMSWIVRGPLAEALVVPRAVNAVLVAGDWGRSIIASGTWTQTLAPAATLGDGWWVGVRNNGTGAIAIDPSGAEQIDGATVIQLAPGESCVINCTGSAFYTIGRTSPASQAQVATAFDSGGAVPAFTLSPVPALAAYVPAVRYRVKFHAAGSGADTLSVSGLGAKSIKQYNAAGAKVSAVIAAGQLADVEYDGVDFVVLDVLPGASQPGFRNKIRNGRMDIAQRGTTFAAITNGAYCLDCWGFANTSAAILTASQQASGPNYEFPTALRLAVTTADAAIAAGDQATVGTVIEGFNVRDLIGKDFILGFWVKSPKAGKHCVAFRNSGTDRSFVAEYTVNTANTAEIKVVAVPGGLPTAGAWDWASGAGLRVSWALAAGATYQTTADAWQAGNFVATANQVNCLDGVGNAFEITGVQLEPGLIATPFEHRFIDAELALCQRFFEKSYPLSDAPGTNYGASSATSPTGIGKMPHFNPAVASTLQPNATWEFCVPKRAAPTCVIYDGLGASGRILTSNGNGVTPAGIYATDRRIDVVPPAISTSWVSAHYTASAEIPYV